MLETSRIHRQQHRFLRFLTNSYPVFLRTLSHPDNHPRSHSHLILSRSHPRVWCFRPTLKLTIVLPVKKGDTHYSIVMSSILGMQRGGRSLPEVSMSASTVWVKVTQIKTALVVRHAKMVKLTITHNTLLHQSSSPPALPPTTRLVMQGQAPALNFIELPGSSLTLVLLSH